MSIYKSVAMFAGMAGSMYGAVKQSGGGVSLAGFQLSAAVKEVTKRSYNKTKYPVESGGVISDHISTQPPTLQIDGVISAMTLGVTSGISSVISSGISLESLKSGMVGGKQRLTNAKKALEAIADQKAAITVVTGIDVYEDYTIDELSCSRDNTAEKLTVSISLSKIDKAEAVWAEITRQSTVTKVARKGGVTKKSGGAAKTTTTSGEEKKEERTGSVSFSLEHGGVRAAAQEVIKVAKMGAGG